MICHGHSQAENISLIRKKQAKSRYPDKDLLTSFTLQQELKGKGISLLRRIVTERLKKSYSMEGQ
jgi:hypothetical protein